MDKIAALSEILEHNPEDTFARYGLAMAFAAEGRDPDALREYDHLNTHAPDYVPAFQMSGQLLLKLGRTADARQRLHAGLAAAQRTDNTHAQNELQAMLDDLPA